MSEWGRVVFFYDYEKTQKNRGRIRVKGLVSKAYKYPGVFGMILHAYNGTRYFWELRNHERINFDYVESHFFEWDDLNTAFDVNFDYRTIGCGNDSVTNVMHGEEQTDEKTKYDLFMCEGTDGFFYVTYTDRSQGEPVLRYGYFLYGTLTDPRAAVEKAFKRQYGYDYRRVDDLPWEIHRALLFFEEHGTPITSEEDFWGIENDGLQCINEVRKAKKERAS